MVGKVLKDSGSAAAGGRGPDAYRSLSGTSMAAPHVAGAAAVVKQRHPGWTAQQIKATLVSSARSAVPGDVRETGGGRLDVDRNAGTPRTRTGSPGVLPVGGGAVRRTHARATFSRCPVFGPPSRWTIWA